MSSLVDGTFIKRRCYLKLGAGTVLSCIRLRADCFFRHWPLKATGIDEEGYVRAVAMASYPDRQRVAEVELRIDPLTSDLIEYRYTDQGSAQVFALVDGEYVEQTSEDDEKRDIMD
jgi:uncharacterized protein YuzB (UPF0349 family)